MFLVLAATATMVVALSLIRRLLTGRPPAARLAALVER